MDESIYKIITLINSKPPAYWIRRIIILIFLSLVIYMIANFTFIFVTVNKHDGITDTVSLYGSSQNKKESPVLLVGNIALIQRSTVSIRATAVQYMTNKSLPDLPLLGVASVTINLYKDHDVEKYSGDSLGCTSYDKENNKALSYSCTNPVNLVYYERSSDPAKLWENKLVAKMTNGFPPIYSIQPFMGGVVGIQQHPDTDKEYRDLIFTYDSNGTKKTYDLPPEIDQNDIQALNLVVDKASTASNKILIVNTNTGELYLGTINNGTISYSISKVSDRYMSDRDMLSCAFLETTAYCYSGESSVSSDHPHDDKLHNDKPSTIEIFNFTEENTASEVYTLTKQIDISKLYVTRSKHLYFTSQNESPTENIYSIILENKKATPKIALTNISFATFGDGLWYVQNNAVYKIDDEKNESYMAFASENTNISNITAIGGDIFFTAFISNMPDQKVHTYKLLDHASNLSHGKRPVDILPFYLRDLMLSMDYMDTIVRIRVFSTATPDSSGQRLLYDEGEYENNRLAIESALASRGITSDNYEIIYSK